MSFDGTSRLWDAVAGTCLFAFSDHRRAAYTLAFSPQGNFLATASGDGWLYIYNILVCDSTTLDRFMPLIPFVT